MQGESRKKRRWARGVSERRSARAYTDSQRRGRVGGRGSPRGTRGLSDTPEDAWPPSGHGQEGRARQSQPPGAREDAAATVQTMHDRSPGHAHPVTPRLLPSEADASQTPPRANRDSLSTERWVLQIRGDVRGGCHGSSGALGTLAPSLPAARLPDRRSAHQGCGCGRTAPGGLPPAPGSPRPRLPDNATRPEPQGKPLSPRLPCSDGRPCERTPATELWRRHGVPAAAEGPTPPLPAAGARLVGAATSRDHGVQAWPRARADSDRAAREGASGPGGLHVGVGGGSNQREEADTRQPGPRRPLPRRCLRHFGNTAVCGLAGIPGRRHWMGTKGH